VKPTRSTKTTDTIRRSSRAPAAAASNGWPHAKQNRAPSGFSCPQFEHFTTR
jgi:hypothetical protein